MIKARQRLHKWTGARHLSGFLLIWLGGFCFGEIVKEKNGHLYVIAQVIAAVGKVILLIIFLGVIFYIFKKWYWFLNQPREDGVLSLS